MFEANCGRASIGFNTVTNGEYYPIKLSVMNSSFLSTLINKLNTKNVFDTFKNYILGEFQMSVLLLSRGNLNYCRSEYLDYFENMYLLIFKVIML